MIVSGAIQLSKFVCLNTKEPVAVRILWKSFFLLASKYKLCLGVPLLPLAENFRSL